MMGDPSKTYARDWIDADRGTELSLTPEDRQLAHQLIALGRADHPQAGFAGQVSREWMARKQSASLGEPIGPTHRQKLWSIVQPAWQWGAALIGIALLVGVLTLSMKLLPQGANTPGSVQPSPTQPLLTSSPVFSTSIPSPHIYIVQEADTWMAIAFRFSLSVKELQELNGLEAGSMLYVGEKLIVGPTLPMGTSSPTNTQPTQKYIVQADDTWMAIASRFGMTVLELKALNGLDETSELFVGEILSVHPSVGSPNP